VLKSRPKTPKQSDQKAGALPASTPWYLPETLDKDLSRLKEEKEAKIKAKEEKKKGPPTAAVTVELVKGLRASVIHHTAEDNHELYVIRCRTDELPEWEVKRPYDAFRDLHAECVNNIPNMPKLPRRHMFKGETNAQVVAERMAGLPEVLHAALDQPGGQHLPCVLGFLAIDQAAGYFQEKNRLREKEKDFEEVVAGTTQGVEAAREISSENVVKQEAETKRIIEEAQAALAAAKEGNLRMIKIAEDLNERKKLKLKIIRGEIADMSRRTPPIMPG